MDTQKKVNNYFKVFSVSSARRVHEVFPFDETDDASIKRAFDSAAGTAIGLTHISTIDARMRHISVWREVAVDGPWRDFPAVGRYVAGGMQVAA